jgi:MOSC domain-containing protein YiiM
VTGAVPQTAAETEGTVLLARGSVVSVNVGCTREFDHQGKAAASAIWKSPVAGRVRARGVNLEGDEQADRAAHGGPAKAVYAYAIEDSRWWGDRLGRSLGYGELGQNLDIEGIDVTNAVVGERWEIGSAVLEVSEPRIPCWRLAARMHDPLFPRRFTEAGRPGTYLRIAREGALGAGDEVQVVERPGHGLTIGDVFRIFTRDRGEIGRLLEVPQLSPAWRDWAQQLLEARQARDAAAGPGCC